MNHPLHRFCRFPLSSNYIQRWNSFLDRSLYAHIIVWLNLGTMSNDLHDLLKTSREIKGTLAPVQFWKHFLTTPIDRTIKSNFTYTGLSSVFADLMKNPLVENKNSIDRILEGIRPKNGLGADNPLLNSILAITGNQYDITSSLTRSLTSVMGFPRPQAATPSFLQNVFAAPVVDYNRKISSLNSVLTGLSSQITAKSFIGIDPELLQRFTTTTKQAAAITTEITEKEFATTDDILKLETFIGSSLEEFKQTVTEQIHKASKSRVNLISLWVTVFSVLVTIFAIVQTCISTATQPATDAATSEQVKELKEFVERKFEETLKSTTTEARTRINCGLKFKPRSNGNTIYTLKAGDTIHIIRTYHKWAQITVIDPADHLPVSGWILKKYLSKSN